MRTETPNAKEGLLKNVPITYPCGCANRKDESTGALRSIVKCPFHRKASGKQGMAYHVEMGCIVAGVPQHARYARELHECLVSMQVDLCDPKYYKRPHVAPAAIEIGCGLGMYCPYITQRGYTYEGVEMDLEAADWTSSTFCVRTFVSSFEQWEGPSNTFDLLLAAHVLEHMAEAPLMLKKMVRLLIPGGRLLIIVPDDQDPVNPDHLWFFNQGNLKGLMQDAGLEDVRMTTRKRVAHEDFIYATGVKA